MNVIIIGSGVAGLASAIRLSCKGYNVTIYESNDYPGGKLTQFSDGGYRFDAGPSVFTMPSLLEELFDLTGEDLKKYFSYKKLQKTCTYLYEDHTVFNSYSNKELLAREIQDKLNVDPKPALQYLKTSGETYDSASDIFLNNSLHKASTWLNKQTMITMLKSYKYNLFESLNSVNSRKLNHPKLVQLFNRFATYNGSNPYVAPGILSSIAHLEQNLGVYFPLGGMHKITEALVNLASKMGVNIKYGCKVERIKVKQGKAIGVIVNGKLVEADRVVSNMDVYPTYKHLMPDQKPPKRILKQERSSSGLIFYWGVKGSFNNLGLHNIFFAEDYRQEFEHLFNKKDIHNDPTVYVNITSKHNPSDAPDGHENWFVMVNAPSNIGQDWEAITTATRLNVQDKLSRMLNIDLKDRIVFEKILDPVKIESKTSSFQGSLYGTSSNSPLSAFLRHPNFSSRIKGLYFVGGSVHPGGGIPLCMLSAKIMSENFS